MSEPSFRLQGLAWDSAIFILLFVLVIKVSRAIEVVTHRLDTVIAQNERREMRELRQAVAGLDTSTEHLRQQVEGVHEALRHRQELNRQLTDAGTD